jgi:replicative DNA helicase
MAQFQKKPQTPPVDPAIAALRVPPHSIEAEQSVLGGLLLDSGAYDKISDAISETDFYRDEHRRLTW